MERWLSADRTYRLLAEEWKVWDPGDTICERARAGLLKAKARLVVMGNPEERLPNVPLTPSFWRPGYRTPIEQSWKTGDFVASEDGDEVRAYDVSFAFDDVLQMVSAERRGAVARGLSVAGDPSWRSALTARRFIYQECGHNPASAADILIDHCRLGFVPARAAQMQRMDGPSGDKWTTEEREWDIPLWFWTDFTASGASSQDWERGVFAGRGNRGEVSITLTGVYFSADALSELLPRPAPLPTVATAPSTTGGRPPAPFWDDLWCAVWGRIFRAELIPKRQAEIERAILDWTVAKGHTLSETAARERAVKAWAEYSREAGNP